MAKETKDRESEEVKNMHGPIFIIEGKEVQINKNLMIRISPAKDDANLAKDLLRKCEAREGDALSGKGFALGVYDFTLLMDSLRDLDQDIPIEIGLSQEHQGGRSRMLRICHGDTKIFIAGRSKVHPSDNDPYPDVIESLSELVKRLQERITELEEESRLRT